MAIQKRIILGIGAGTALALAALAQSARAVLPDDLRVGAVVDVEGKPIDARTVIATEVEVQPGMLPDPQIKGVISAVDPAARSMTISGVKVVANPEAVIEDPADAPMEFSRFAVGKRGKAEGEFANGVLKADEVSLKDTKPGKENEVGITGQITSVDRAAETFVVLGIRVRVTPQTQVAVSQ
jgi:hypothetical protein